MSMFCYQCQETAKGTGCELRGVCGKTEEVAKLQDLLIYTIKGVSEVVVKGKIDVSKLDYVNQEVLSSLFMLVVDNLQDAIRDDDTICRPEATLHPAGEVYALLNEHRGIGAVLLCRFDLLKDIGSIAGGAIIHFRVVPGQVFCRVSYFHGHPPQLIVHKVPLMPVHNEDLLLRGFILQQQRFAGNDSVKQLVRVLTEFVIIGVIVFFGKRTGPQINIVIAIEKHKPILIKKSLDRQKDIGMRQPDRLEIRIFPKIVPVSDFDIFVAVVIIMVQRMACTPGVSSRSFLRARS